MEVTSSAFKANVRRSLADQELQKALKGFGLGEFGLSERRRSAVQNLPEFDVLRDRAKDIKDRSLENLAGLLEQFEANCRASGGKVHWCETAEDARRAILEICQEAGATTVTKGKSMVTEEIGLNDYLSGHGISATETDLGEYIIQLRGEAPSHPITPAIHLTKEEVAGSFRRAHTQLPADRKLSEAKDLLDEARTVLRRRFFEAKVGITGANFLIAETGSAVIVTNEGNGDLTQLLSKVHVVVTSIEKVIPTLEDAATMLRVLARSALGQEMSAYTTFATGPRREDELVGPQEFHVVLLDNGRSRLLGTDMQEVLRCIRCGACMNNCPVYATIGGHAYGWVYPGPIGAVLTPNLTGLAASANLPNASTFCGRCESVCPVRIPLPGLMRKLREREFSEKLAPARQRLLLAGWAQIANRPWLYRTMMDFAGRSLRRLAGRRNALTWLPLAGGWTRARDLPAPEGASFVTQWHRGRGISR